MKADKAFVRTNGTARLLSWIIARYARDYDGEFFLPSAPLSLRVNKRRPAPITCSLHLSFRQIRPGDRPSNLSHL